MEQRICIKKQSICVRGQLYDLSVPRVMGILNMTPDSFYAGSRAGSDVGVRAGEMLRQGADILDIGGYSSRPGAEEISAAQEYDRLAPALDAIRAEHPEAILSVDTFRAEVARRVVENFDVDIINDIGGGTLDPEMRDTVAGLRVPYILMHTRGTPDTMQQMCHYDDVVADILADLAFKIDDFHQAGVTDIIADPGFGFAKTTEQNYRLLAALNLFHETGCPVLVGMSRKSMLYKPLGITPETAGDATVAVHSMALMLGADILRVHDVLPAVQSVRIFRMIRDANCNVIPDSRSSCPDITYISRQTHD